MVLSSSVNSHNKDIDSAVVNINFGSCMYNNIGSDRVSFLFEGKSLFLFSDWPNGFLFILLPSHQAGLFRLDSMN